MKTWLAEGLRLALVFLLAAVAGVISGAVAWWLLAAAVAVLAFHLWRLHGLHKWLQEDPARARPPNFSGIWGELIDSLYRQGKQTRRRNDHADRLIERFREITRALPDAFVVLGPETEIMWLNEAAARLLSLDPQADIGQRLGNLLRHPEFQRFLSQDEAPATFEFQSPAQPHVRLELRKVPFGEQERLIIARDVSDFHRIEQMRRDFIANVSHELRTPLTVLSGYLEAWEDMREELPAPLQPSLEYMRAQTTRMQQLIEDLLTLSRLDSEGALVDDPEAVPVPDIVAELKEAAIVLSGSGRHRIEAEIDDGLFLRGAAKELHSAMGNLVSNAVRYTPAGGRILLRWVAGPGGTARFEVSDSGIGIAPGDIQRITERFYRVDKDRSRTTGGTGLGLAIVKHVMQRHGGRLEIESTLGQGSTFTCVFPASRVWRSAPEDAMRRSEQRVGP